MIAVLPPRSKFIPPDPRPMTYSDYTVGLVEKGFGITMRQAELFAGVKAVTPPSWLADSLGRGMQLALISEKARSEFIVGPVLLASRELCQNRFAIYSGHRLDVDPQSGLAGECDFLLAETEPLPELHSPLATIVEAKKNDIESGLGQCAAQMVGARRFNEIEGQPPRPIFGCITTGEVWFFLKLEDQTLWVDRKRYLINEVGSILAAIQAMFDHGPPS